MKLKTKIIIGFLYYFAVCFFIVGISLIKEGIAPAIFGIAIGIAFGYCGYKYMRRKQAEAEEAEEQELQEMLAQSTTIPPSGQFNLIAPDIDDDEEEDDDEDRSFSIKGINYASIDDSYLGDHEGYIKAVTDNPKDPYAIAVYVGKKRVGWLPGGNSKLHQQLLSIGGKAKVNVLISKGYDDDDNRPFYYGKAAIPR